LTSKDDVREVAVAAILLVELASFYILESIMFDKLDTCFQVAAHGIAGLAALSRREQQSEWFPIVAVGAIDTAELIPSVQGAGDDQQYEKWFAHTAILPSQDASDRSTGHILDVSVSGEGLTRQTVVNTR
jgi:hypothetical protein